MAPSYGRQRTAFVFATLTVASFAFSRCEASAAVPAHGTSVIAERPGVAAVRIARNPETGGWMLAPLPTDAVAEPAASPEEQLALNQSDAGLLTEPLPGGGWLMNLQGRFQSFSVVRQDAAGALRFDCGEDPISLFRWLVETPEPVDAQGRPIR